MHSGKMCDLFNQLFMLKTRTHWNRNGLFSDGYFLTKSHWKCTKWNYRSSCCSPALCWDAVELRLKESFGIDSGKKSTTKLPNILNDATNNIKKYGWILFCCEKSDAFEIRINKIYLKVSSKYKPKGTNMERWWEQRLQLHYKLRLPHFESLLDTIQRYIRAWRCFQR